MIKIKRFLSLSLILLSGCFIIIISIFLCNKDTITYGNTKNIIIADSNDYTKNYNFLKLQQLDNYTPNNYEDIINIYYSILNQGWNSFTFYCPSTYDNCLKDVDEISNNEKLLANVNNYVHPFNSYSSIKTSYDESGEVTIKITHLYNNDDIKNIENELTNIISKIKISDTKDQKKIIKAIHDFVVEYTKYDTKKGNNLNSPYDSSRIGGVLFDHYAVCSGYSDTIALLLDYYEIENFKISNENHVWNAVKLNNKWYHLDATWDDPVSKNNTDTLSHDYFLLNTSSLHEKLESYDEHIFDENFYLELKEDN